VVIEVLKLRAFQNRVLRRIFRPKRDEVAGGWKKLHNKELHNLYTSPHITTVIKAKWMKTVDRAERMGEMK
jgi:hypothetical protein